MNNGKLYSGMNDMIMINAKISLTSSNRMTQSQRFLQPFGGKFNGSTDRVVVVVDVRILRIFARIFASFTVDYLIKIKVIISISYYFHHDQRNHNRSIPYY